MRKYMICTPRQNSDYYIKKTEIGEVRMQHFRGQGDAFRILVGKPEGKRPLGRPRCRWESNIQIRLKWDGGTGWIDPTQVGNEWRAVVNAVMNIPFP